MNLNVPTEAGIAIALAALAAMEGVAYVAHRWVMHGLMWGLHRSHHSPRAGVFEANDWFAVMGALPAIALIFAGTVLGWGSALMWVGVGVTGYGMIYFGFHDVIVHRRVPVSWVPRGRYMKRIVQAHRLHHVVETKAGTVSFGFIYAPPVRELLAKLERNGGGRIRDASSKVRREMA
ncbi:sterol desaturase family protein [uncultured Sphingomonas sp.]|uniref:sterol desaturase family protein n=1 Tax=uncultured Sphingomonas sp. TaxID=158754 RepID=UPI0035CB2195